MDPGSLIGKIIADRYEVLSVAGSGGMGTVFKARQADLERLVALKILDPGLILDEDSIKRFEREAKSLSLLQNVHVARFYTYGMLGEQMPYIVMEYIEGESLSSRLQSGNTLAVEKALKIAYQVSEALSFAHKAGIVHRDLKPANILLMASPDPDFVKVVDFGLSYLATSGNSSESLTRTGQLMGTPQYLSPEQCMGRKADARSDVYALGCILYEMICGVTPFVSDTAMGFIHQHVSEEVVPPSRRIKAELPAGLELLIRTSLAKDPDDRYQSMDELNEDLRRILAGVSPEVLLRSDHKLALGRAQQRKQMLKSTLALSAVALLGLAVFAAYYFSPAGLGIRCSRSIAQDSSIKNLTKWLEQAEDLENSNEIKQSKNLLESIDSAISFRKLGVMPAAKVKIQLAQKLFEIGKYDLARKFAIDSVFDLNEAKKHHQIAEHEGQLADLVYARMKKAKPKKANDRVYAELAIAVALLVANDEKQAVILSEDAARMLEQRRLAHRLDADTRAYAFILIQAFDLPYTSEAYSLRANHYHNASIAALRLCQATDSPADEASEKFIDRRRNVARSFIAVADQKGARQFVQQIMKTVEKDSGNYDWARLRIAAIDELLGDPKPIQQMFQERLKTMNPVAATIYISDGQVWAGNNGGANRLLEGALKYLARRNQDEIDDEIGIYRAIAHSCRDSGDVAGTELNLKKCLNLMADNNNIAGKYNATHFQVSRDLIEVLKDQHKTEEARKIAEAHSLTGAESFLHK